MFVPIGRTDGVFDPTTCLNGCPYALPLYSLRAPKPDSLLHRNQIPTNRCLSAIGDRFLTEPLRGVTVTVAAISLCQNGHDLA